jgi:putative spermidine/putrescine transport system substrate-binding protein
MKQPRILALAGVVALLAAACSGGASGSAAPTPQQSIGQGEGALNLVTWAGYAERGASDPAYDWVTPFEAKTGCKVSNTDMTDSNNGVALMQSGDYDGISASGDATTRLIAGGIVAPVNTALLANYANVYAGLKDLPHNTVDGVNYGIPHGRGPNLLAYNTDVVTPEPTSWDPVWEGGSDYQGKISVYDSSIYIADAALHLMTKRPELGIKNPYQLTEAQFNEAIKLLEAQKANGATYWAGVTDQVSSFSSGDAAVGTTWQYQLNLLGDDNKPVKGILPEEGSTGWSDTWMIASKAKHPNCMLMWMDHMMSAEANGQATVWFGEAPTSPQACEVAEKLSPGHCELTHANDEAYYDKIWYWASPQADCADDDAATTCKDQDDWVEAWTKLRGA